MPLMAVHLELLMVLDHGALFIESLVVIHLGGAIDDQRIE